MQIQPTSAVSRWSQRGLLFLPGLVVAALIAAFVDVVIGALVAAVVLIAVGFLFATAGRRVLRALDARPLGPGEFPRVRNLVVGVSGDLGFPPPSIWILSDDSPNALVCDAGGPALAITAGARQDLTLTELEAVVTHSLIRATTTDLKWASVVAVLGIDRLAQKVGRSNDVQAVAVTRFPPALASALAKSPGTQTRFGPLWFSGRSTAHTPLEERIALLQDL